uniref:Uncharacterized protein n=1 Tax=Scophthalmus maximus TaxID=52904 RepID=A0A8D2ZHY1_SCOMX
MAVSFTLRSIMLRRSLHGAFSLHRRTRGPPVAGVGLRFVCDAAPEEKKMAVIESVEEYSFVERLIPLSRVPAPPHHAGPTPSGWMPPADSPPPLFSTSAVKHSPWWFQVIAIRNDTGRATLEFAW